MGVCARAGQAGQYVQFSIATGLTLGTTPSLACYGPATPVYNGGDPEPPCGVVTCAADAAAMRP
eukprot:1774136-Rhodomonas_salina.3